MSYPPIDYHSLGHLAFDYYPERFVAKVEVFKKGLMVEIPQDDNLDDILSGKETVGKGTPSMMTTKTPLNSGNFEDCGSIHFSMAPEIISLNPKNGFDEGDVFETNFSAYKLLNWGKRTTCLTELMLNCPNLMAGREDIGYNMIIDYFRGRYCANELDISAFHWILIECLASYLIQFKVDNDKILWLDGKTPFLNGNMSYTRKIFGEKKNKLFLKIEVFNLYHVVVSLSN